MNQGDRRLGVLSKVLAVARKKHVIPQILSKHLEPKNLFNLMTFGSELFDKKQNFTDSKIEGGHLDKLF